MMKTVNVYKAINAIPIDLKLRLLELAKLVPATRQGDFLRSTVQRLENFAEVYPRTLLWSAIGLVAGHLVHSITGLSATLPGLLIGGGFGLHRDLFKSEIQIEVTKVIGEELEKHTSAGAKTETDHAA